MLPGPPSGERSVPRADAPRCADGPTAAASTTPAGTYTIEATTFRSYSATNPRRSTGDYVLRVSVDHTPRAADHPTQLNVANGETLGRTWRYQPGAATVSVTSVAPDGLDAAVTGSDGFATLIATPTRTGNYTVKVTYDNSGTTKTIATAINSYCPTGQDELPAGCGTERAMLGKGADVLVFDPPNGYDVPSACHEKVLTESLSRLWCRRVQDSRVYILKSDPRIRATGDRFINGDRVDLGRILMIEPDGYSVGDPLEGLEGCQPITTEHWRCDYHSDQHWQADWENHTTFSDYAIPALSQGVLDPTGKLAVCALAYVRWRAIRIPQFGAVAVGACSAAVVPPGS